MDRRLRIICCILSTLGQCHIQALSVSNQTKSDGCNRSYFVTDSGFINSHNYPFSYTSNLECELIIEPQNIFPQSICFTFFSFRMSSRSDSLEFYDERGVGHRYTLGGEVLASASPGDFVESHQNRADLYDRASVWSDNFCWPVPGDFLKVKFRTSIATAYSETENLPRFYATYTTALPKINKDGRVKVANASEENVQKDTSNPPSSVSTAYETAPCEQSNWTCQNRRCVSKSLVCDGVNDCSDNSDETYVHTQRCGSAGFGGCDCSMAAVGGRDCGLTLNRFKSLTARVHPHRGPTRDHTQGQGTILHQQHFLGTSFSTKDTGVALIEDLDSAEMKPSDDYCFSFWYHMYGRDPGNLTVIITSLPATRPVWFRSGNHMDVWRHGEVKLPATTDFSQPYMVKFAVAMGSDVKTTIALDDFYLHLGVCSGDDVSCTFELGFCEWQTASWDGSFRRVRGPGEDGLGPTGDHSSSDNSGIYLYWNSGSSTSLLSPPLTTFTDASMDGCLHFWYYYSDESSGWARLRLDIYKVYSDGTEMRIRGFNIRPRTDWTFFSYSISSSTALRLRLDFSRSSSSVKSAVAIDNIALLPDTCDQFVPGSCSREEFRCWEGKCISKYRVCDGYRDCDDGYDETPVACNDTACECSFEEFCCSDWNATCINETLVCNGVRDCTNGADESSRRCNPYRSIPAGVIVAILMIGGVAMGVIIIILVKCIRWIVKNQCPHLAVGRGRDRRESVRLSVINESLWQAPPTYTEAVDNPAYMPPPRESEIREAEQTPPPPKYEQILSGEFKELFWPTKAELEELKQQTVEKYKDIIFPDNQTTQNLNKNTVTDATPSTSTASGGQSGSPRLQSPIRSARNSVGATVTIDKEAVRKILRGSFRNRQRRGTDTPQDQLQPMITIKIFGSRSGAGERERPGINTRQGAVNPAFDVEERDHQGTARVSQTNVNIQLMTDSDAGQVSCVTIDTRGREECDSCELEARENLTSAIRQVPEGSGSARSPTRTRSQFSSIGDASDSTDEPVLPSVNL